MAELVDCRFDLVFHERPHPQTDGFVLGRKREIDHRESPVPVPTISDTARSFCSIVTEDCQPTHRPTPPGRNLSRVNAPSPQPRDHARASPKAAWDTEHLPEGEDKVRAVRAMFDTIAPRYDMVNRIMTFRLDVRWRRLAVKKLGLSPGSNVLDLASGTGDLCVDLRRAGLQPISVDLSFGMLAADRSGSPRCQADILNLPVAPSSVDGATCGFALRNLVDLPAFFAELARVVRPGGRIALLDVGVPRNPIVRFGNGIYFGRIVPRIGGWLSDPAAYRYLPKSVAYLPPTAEMLDALRKAGFTDATHRQLSGGITQLFVATRD
jgi:demethylmenaquinone methyltransferase/2-methoxy-6-polyprenyl-1,4-benzoquinol methylase